MNKGHIMKLSIEVQEYFVILQKSHVIQNIIGSAYTKLKQLNLLYNII